MKFPIEKHFKLSESFLEEYKTKSVAWGFNGLGGIIYYRTYSRLLEDGKNEEWWQTVRRVVEGIYSIQWQHIDDYQLGWNQAKAKRSAEIMYDRIFNMKFLPAGRSLWAMGAPVIMDKGLAEALFNCAFLSTENIKEEPGKVFANCMDFEMCGIGAGINLEGSDKIKIKQPSGKKQIYIIPDSREGWVESLRILINSYFGLYSEVEFDYSQIRPEGLPLKTFGGISSGYKPLEELHVFVRKTLDENIGKPLSQRIIADIANNIGKTVVAGNVRRSSEIILGDYHSQEFLNLKNFDVYPERQSFSWASNNSIYADLGMDYKPYTDSIVKSGDPGFVWIKNAQDYGRMRETEKTKKDFRVEGVNPCFSGDSLLLTKNGYVEIRELEGKSFDIINGWTGTYSLGSVTKTGVKKTITLFFDNGKTLRCTPEHIIYCVDNFTSIEAKDSLHKNIRVFHEDKSEVVEIKENEEEEVYDFSITDALLPHWGVVNGFVVHNCGEIFLENGELCNLVETFPNKHENLEDYLTTLKYAYLYAKTITLLNTSWSGTNRVMLRNRRLGISVSGIAQFIANHSMGELKSWMEEGYNTVSRYDKVYSSWFCIPESIKLTTVKPSGTVSLLNGSTPGIHTAESRYYIRRVRIANNSQLIAPLLEAGYTIEPCVGQEDVTSVVEIPVDAGEGVREIKDVSMWEQLSLAAFMQENWSDNGVSVTVTFDPQTEAKDLHKALNYFQYKLKGVSFLARLDYGIYPQMPYETITKEKYEELSAKLTPVDFSTMYAKDSDKENEKYCTNDTCAL